MSNVFCRYDLRTLDVDAARSFYEDVLALDFGAPSSIVAAWPLHEQARARGVPPHWLGQIGVEDLEAFAKRLVELGGERLGATVRANDGAVYAAIRDPFGAVVALRESAHRPQQSPVSWHQLHTRDLERAWATYSDLFGWTETGAIEAADPEGGHRLFCFEKNGSTIGSIANTARWPGVHTHWLFYFPVKDLDSASASVRAKGGVAKNPVTLPSGERLVACEDPQGAAFGLTQS